MKTTGIRDINRKLKKHLIDVNELKETFEYLLQSQQMNYAVKGLIGISLEYVTLLDILNEYKNSTILDKDKEIQGAVIFLKNVLHNLNALFIMEQQEKGSIINKLKKIKQELLKHVRVLTAYEDNLEVYDFLLARVAEKGFFEQQDIQDIDNEYFAQEVVRFVFAQKENFIVSEKLKTVLRYLPLRITKQKFYDYITSSVGNYYGAYAVDLDAFIHMIMDVFYPERVEGYGELFQFIAEPLEDIKKINFNHLSIEEIDELTNKVNLIEDDISLMINLYNYTTGIINKTIAITEKTSNVEADDLLQAEPAIASVNQILEISKQMIKEDLYGFTMSDEMVKQLVELEGKQEKWMEQIDRYTDVINYAVDEYKETIAGLGLTGAFGNIKVIQILNSDNLFAEPEQYISDYSEYEQVDNRVANKKAQELISFIDEKIRDMPNNIRRAKMSLVLYMMPPAFGTTQEVTSYMLNAMEMCRDKSEKLAAVDAIRQIMESYGYNPSN